MRPRHAFGAAAIVLFFQIWFLIASEPSQLKTVAPIKAPSNEPVHPLPLKLGLGLSASTPVSDPSEAFASDLLVSNGFTAQQQFLDDFDQFSENANEFVEFDKDGNQTKEGGLGPTFNGQSCSSCHPNGRGSAAIEVRAGYWNGTVFTAPPGGTLVRLMATDPRALQRVPEDASVVAERIATELGGLGHAEQIADRDLLTAINAQPANMRGLLVVVDVPGGIDKNGVINFIQRIGRFGHKCQHGSLLRFAADADRNEKGRTSPLEPFKSLALDGRSLMPFVHSTALDDPGTTAHPYGEDIEAYNRFMRSLPAPARNFATQNSPSVLLGEQQFAQIGCAVCHIPTWKSADVGSSINGFGNVPDVLGGKTFHPYSDFALHDIGTGDGIIQGGPPETRNMIRTSLLWGLRRRTKFMHDGRSFTLLNAIQRHTGQADKPKTDFMNSSPQVQQGILDFLKSL